MAELGTRVSVTERIQEYLDDNVTPSSKPMILEAGTMSVVEFAAMEGLTMQAFVNKDPDRAIKIAEGCLAEWLKLQSNAAITGTIETTVGRYTINKEMTTLLNRSVETATKQLDTVMTMAFNAYGSGERRLDHLTRALYNRAVHKGDTRALMYLIDRVDGKPVESKAVNLDYDNAYNVYQIIHTLFDKQLEVLNSGVGTKLICCSRRSGKTHLMASAALIDCLMHPNTTCIYIGPTLELIEQVLDSTINKIVDGCRLRDRTGKRLNWKHLDNGSMILVRGLSNTQDPDQILGRGAKTIIIDEFFNLKSNLLEYLIREVLRPMQMDYPTEYKFIAAGTPPPNKGTYGEYAWKNWDVPHFVWTWEDNPFPADPELKRAYIEKELQEIGQSWDTPYARRMYGGEWIYDDDLALYPEWHEYDSLEALPSFNIDMVLFGIDYGTSDNDCLIGIGWDTAARRGWVFHEDKFNRLDIKDRTVSQLQFLQGQVVYAWDKALEFFPTLGTKDANKRILWLADDNDQHLTDHFNINCRLMKDPEIRLNIMNAHKTDKVFMQDKIRDLFRTANLLLPKGGKTALECKMTVLKRGINGQVYPEIDDKVYHPDLLAALRYALYPVIGREKENKDGQV